MPQKLDLSAIPAGFWILIAVLGTVQLVLEVWALVSLIRRPRELVVGGNKWAWAALIVLVNTIGAILWFALGRKPAPAREAVPGSGSTESVADALYGPREDPR